MLTQVELYLFNLALAEASSPAAKAFALTELKSLETATTNAAFKAVLHALEQFLAAPAAVA